MIPKCARLLSWEGPLPEIGQYLQTPSGSTYLVIQVKPNLRIDPKSVASLKLLKLYPEDKKEMPDNATIHAFKWGTRTT